MSNPEDRILTIGMIAGIAGLLYLFRDQFFDLVSGKSSDKSWLCATFGGAFCASPTGEQKQAEQAKVAEAIWDTSEYEAKIKSLTDRINYLLSLPDPQTQPYTDPATGQTIYLFPIPQNIPVPEKAKTDEELCAAGDSFFCNKAEGLINCGDGIQVSPGMPCPTVTPAGVSPWASTGGCMAQLWQCPSGWQDTGISPSGQRCCVP